MEMNYCMECGGKLHNKYVKGEGDIPFCETCGEYRFPVFNTAVSMIVTIKNKSKILLIRQYGKEDYILCAGYIKKGENAEAAVARELKEELGLEALSIKFNRSHYYEPSNTLMLNYTVTVDAYAEPVPNEEVDSWKWFMKGEAVQKIKKNSLAKRFLVSYLDDEDYS